MCSEPVSSVPCSATEEWALPFHHYSLLNNKREILLSITTVSAPSCLHTHAPLRALPPQPSLPRVLGRCFLVAFGAGSCLPALSWGCSQPAGVIFHPCCGMGPRGKWAAPACPHSSFPAFVPSSQVSWGFPAPSWERQALPCISGKTAPGQEMKKNLGFLVLAVQGE